MSHEKLETNIGWMAILIAVVISFGGLAEIVPLMYQAETIKPLPGVKPYAPLELAGRDIYVREGCYNCHSQMVRTLRFETERYGHYSLAGESVYDRPFQWGSKRTGPDLARIGGRYSDDWHRVHLDQPARPGAGVEHARLPVAGERAGGHRRHHRPHARTARDRRPLHRGRHRGRRLRARRQDRAGRAGCVPAGPGQARTEELT